MGKLKILPPPKVLGFLTKHREFRNNDRISPSGILMRKPTDRKYLLGAVACYCSVFKLLAHRVDLEIFSVFSLTEVLLIVQLMQSNNVPPDYMQNVRYFYVAEIVIFGILLH